MPPANAAGTGDQPGTGPTEGAPADPQHPAPGTEPQPATGEGDGQGDAQLGDAGKQALDRMKAKWQTERDERKRLQEELDAATAPTPGTAQGETAPVDADTIRRQVEAEVMGKANQRVIGASVLAAATNRFINPADAMLHVDMSVLEVDAQGRVDTDDLTAELDRVLQERPYLAAGSNRRFQGGGDGGKQGAPPKTLAEQIREAEKAGDTQRAIALKSQQLFGPKQ